MIDEIYFCALLGSKVPLPAHITKTINREAGDIIRAASDQRDQGVSLSFVEHCVLGKL
jgi:hypothetical protein